MAVLRPPNRPVCALFWKDALIVFGRIRLGGRSVERSVRWPASAQMHFYAADHILTDVVCPSAEIHAATILFAFSYPAAARTATETVKQNDYTIFY